MFKNFLLILLSSIFVYSYLLYYLLACYEWSAIKEHASKSRKENPFDYSAIRLDFKISEIDSLVMFLDEGEFIYQNQRYDVIKKDVSSDLVYFYCIADKEESELLEELGKHVSTFMDDTSSDQESKSSLPFLLKDFICQQIVNKIFFFIKHFIKHHTDFSLVSTSCFLSKINPPPQI